MQFPTVHPAVLGTVTTPDGLRALSRKALPCDAVEVRVDALLAEKVPVEKIEQALAKRKHPVLLTLRIPAEGGQCKWKTPERLALFLRLMPVVEAVDVELATVHEMWAVIEEARRDGQAIVVSAHSIKKPVTSARLAGWLAQYDQEHLRTTAILKVATRIESWRDLQRLAALLINAPTWPIAAMGLGPHAAQSRSVLTALGSRLVYGYLDKPAAPGQPSAAQVRKMVLATRIAE